MLVIESDPGVRQLVSTSLTQAGYAVLEASRGRDGIQAVHQNRPDLVVLDETLSDLSGWEVLARIRETSDGPVLLLTTRDTHLEKLANLDASNEDYLVKPFARAWLPDKLRALMARTQRTSG